MRFTGLISLAMVAAMACATWASAFAGEAIYCYMPCVSKLKGVISKEKERLDDPVMHFDAYFLNVDGEVSVRPNSEFNGVNNVRLIQIRLVGHSRLDQFVGKCVWAKGELTGQVIIQDVNQLVLDADDITLCGD